MSQPYAEVIGDPVERSKSPAIHGYWIEQAGIDARYGATPVIPADLGAFLAMRREDADWRGCNVTMPHKQAVIAHLDALDESAGAVGAVNTIRRESEGRLVGYNTDSAGFLEPLRTELAQPHLFRMARIIGAGGAARAIVAALAREGFTLVLAARDPAKARALLDELAPGGEHHAPPLEMFREPTDFAFDDREGCFDLVINASPLGMRGQNDLAFDFSHAPPGAIAYDIVTDPLETDFLRRARAEGLRTIDGLAMLIGQAAAAFSLFFGIAAPRECDDELRRRLIS